MKTFLKHALFTLLPFLVLDALWLTLVAPAFYKSQIGHLMAENANLVAAGVFYLLYVIGMTFFVVTPGIREGNLVRTMLKGAFFGLIAYSTYDLTNLATLKDWPITITIVDMCWGTFLSGTTALVAAWLGRK